MTDYRASFDAHITFANGGDLSVREFRVDIPSADTPDTEIGRLFIASLGLLMVSTVALLNVRRFPEQHKGTRGGPTIDTAPISRYVELSHVIRADMTTYPGLPGPSISPDLTREDSRAHYEVGTEFEIASITMCGNTGTYLDSPYHRYADGGDLTSVALTQTVDVPAVVVRVAPEVLAIDANMLAAVAVFGKAVLLHTGDATRFGTPSYGENAHYLTQDGAQFLVDRGATIVGIDAINIDQAVPHGPRPAHTVLLGAGVPIVEHLTNLESLPVHGARFTAVPLRISGLGTVSVRAFAKV